MPTKYDLCGIGQSIVDQIVQVEHSLPVVFGLTTGSRTLVDGQKMARFLRLSQGYPYEEAAGGSMSNSLAVFSLLGGSGVLLSSIGEDEAGRLYTEQAEQAGIEHRFLIRPVEKTGKCLILVTPDGVRTMITDLGVGLNLSPECLDEEVISKSQWLFFEAYLLPGSAELVSKAMALAKQHGCKIALSLSDQTLVEAFRPNLIELSGSVDLIIGNEDEARLLADEPNALDALRHLSTATPGVVITCGEKGALLAFDGVNFDCPAIPCKPVDTTGAGDAFAGAFLFGLIQGMSPGDAARGATYVAMRTVTQVGARLAPGIASDWKNFLEGRP